MQAQESHSEYKTWIFAIVSFAKYWLWWLPRNFCDVTMNDSHCQTNVQRNIPVVKRAIWQVCWTVILCWPDSIYFILIWLLIEQQNELFSQIIRKPIRKSYSSERDYQAMSSQFVILKLRLKEEASCFRIYLIHVLFTSSVNDCNGICIHIQQYSAIVSLDSQHDIFCFLADLHDDTMI